jgi:6-pyruvoyl-tetrahydropterin synthase
MLSSKKDRYISITDPEEIDKYIWKQWDNNISIYGWLEMMNSNEIKFYILRKIVDRKEEVLNLKSEIKGTLCSSGSKKQGTTDKEVVYHMLNYLKEQDINYYIVGEYKGNESGEKIKKAREIICDELELILRHRDNIEGVENNRFFYRMEEKRFLDNIRLYENRKNK